MIGWAPLLLTGAATALLVIVVFDASSAFGVTGLLKGHALPTVLHNALNAATQWLSHFGVQDWALVGVAVYLLAWAWVRAFALVRLGTIQIADLTCDDAKLGPAAGKALLQQALGKRGLLPPSGVPNGSPTVGNIADAISKAPIPQANWLGALMGLIPTPPASTGFTITGTLLQLPGQSAGAIQFAYELACTGPQRSVHLGTAEAADAGKAIEVASREIYRTIGTAAPDIYPSWARWSTSEALTSYREGLEEEREGSDYAKACGRYVTASALDPDNMLARLRAANCRERMANGTEDEAERFRLRVLALAGYISIRVRWPEIFESGFRASVLMSVLASEADVSLESDPLLRTTLDRYERATATAARRHGSLQMSPSPSSEALCDRLERAALKEAKCVRHQLRPLWTLRHYQRLRHRFEPTGRERRQLRTALGISKMAQKARSERTRVLEPLGPASPQDRPEQLETAPWNTRSEARQLWWRALVRWRYLGARWHVAGWQAHYVRSRVPRGGLVERSARGSSA